MYFLALILHLETCDISKNRHKHKVLHEKIKFMAVNINNIYNAGPSIDSCGTPEKYIFVAIMVEKFLILQLLKELSVIYKKIYLMFNTFNKVFEIRYLQWNKYWNILYCGLSLEFLSHERIPWGNGVHILQHLGRYMYIVQSAVVTNILFNKYGMFYDNKVL